MTMTIRNMTAAGALALLALLVFPVSAAANHVGCGQVITTDTKLDGDVGPCGDNGIIVAADDVTLDLNGHRVFGAPGPGDGAGVLVSQRRGVHITNGVVTDFDGGVAIEGGHDNKVSNILARDNIGRAPSSAAAGTRYGDGIAILSSSRNHVVHNRTVHNGPYSGIGVFQLVDPDHPRAVSGPATGNVIDRNTVLDNNICRTPTGPCDDDGIRLEPQVQGNIVTNNHVTGSGLDGISLVRGASDNFVEGNVADANGFHSATHRKGDGIRVFSDRNLVRHNHAARNAADGIGVGFRTGAGAVVPAVENRIFHNITGLNLGFDLHDINPGCDANQWAANTYDRANPPCAAGP
jgi:parallel beta-helix repeat protein